MMRSSFLLLPLIVDKITGYKLMNYGEILKEIPFGRNFYDFDEDGNVEDNTVGRKTVKELLKMNEDYLEAMDYNQFYDVNQHNPVKLSDETEFDNVDIYHENSNFHPETVEDMLENMLGRDFFDDKKFILFLIFSLVIMILVLCWCLISIQWCFR